MKQSDFNKLVNRDIKHLIEKMTEPQEKVFNYLVKFFNENDQLPPMATIAERFRWKSPNAAQCYLNYIERAGMIERNEVGKYRFKRDANGNRLI